MDIPKNIKKLLNNQKLCSLATCSDKKPYLSLMNFTYVEKENIIILSSRKNSKKFENIIKNISILIFSSTKQISATFLGTANIIIGKDKSYYRNIHLKKSDMTQFILGDDKGVVVFNIEKIIVSNNQDKVEYFCKDNIEKN